MVDFDRLERLLERVILEMGNSREQERKAREQEREQERKAREQEREQERKARELERENDRREHKRLTKETDKRIENLSIQISGYTFAEGKSIEEEVERKVPKYLKRKFVNYSIFKVHDDWRYLQKNKIDEVNHSKCRDERSITEFDGLYIISNDKDYEIGSQCIQNKANLNSNVVSKTYRFVVVEAKHTLNIKKVNTKIKQIKEFQEYIAESIHSNDSVYTKEFKNKVLLYQLSLFINQPIYIIFASPHIETDCVQYIKNEANSLMDDGISLAYMTSSGNKYSISFADEGFKMYTNVNTNSISIGAGVKK